MASGSNGRCWLGFDLGGTKMMATVFDERFRILASERTKTKGLEGSKQVMARVVKTIRAALQKSGAKPGALGAIGVGFPGPLDLDKGIVLEAPNLGWKNFHLKDELERTFKCPAVVANDVDAGTYGEYRFGAAKKARCVVGVFPGTGIGGACVYEGNLIRGRNSSCMEIGHIRVEPDGRLCGCGRRGCLEAAASRLAISAEAASAAYRGEAPNLLRLAGTDLSLIKSGALAKSIKAGDKAIERIVRAAARRMGEAIGGVVNLLAPDVVVLGGGLVEAMPDLFLSEVRKAVENTAMTSLAKCVKVVAAELGDDATVMGAASLAAETAIKANGKS